MSPYKIFLLIIWPYLINDFFIIYGALTQRKWVIIPDEILFAIVPFVTILILVRKKIISLKGLGWPSLSDIVEEELFAIGYFIIFYFILLKGLDSNLSKFFEGNPKYQLWSFARPDAYEETVNWWLVFYYALTAGFYEEIIYRGLYTRLFEQHFKSKWLFFLVGAGFFSIVHWCNGPQNLILTFFWGLFALVFYSFRRKLLSLMLMHAAYDIVIFGRLA